jgi:hypothetical protein
MYPNGKPGKLRLAAQRMRSSVGTMLAILNAVILTVGLVTLAVLKFATRVLRQIASRL